MVGNSVNYNPNQYNVLVGGANGTFVSVSPSTSGYVLTSNGLSANPSFQPGGGGGGSDPVGTLKYFATAGGDSFADYLECDGSVVSQATYPALFAQMGLINGNAEVWTLRDSPYSVTSLAVGTLYLAATSNGAYTSTDAITWNVTPINTTTILASAAYVNSLYMVGGNTGFLATSTDAVSWTTQSVGSTGTINSIAFGNSLYVLSDGVTGRSIYTSTDAVTWDVNFNLGSLLGLYSVTYGGSKFVGGGQNGVVVTSTDGSQWTTNKVRPPTITSAGGSPALIYGDKFVATNALSNNAWVGVSTDAKNWDINYVGTTSSIHAVIYESIYVAAGRSGALFTSTDAVTWDSRTSGTSSHIYSLGYGGGLYLYAGSGGALATSTDGITWDARTSGTSSTIFSIGYDGSSLYFYGAGGGGLRTSTDGITWDSRTSGTSSSIYAMGYGNSLYFYGGAGGVLRTSTDGITWDARTSNTAASIYSMLYANSLYLYSTNGGVGTSTDGITWNLWNIDDRSLDFQGLTENGGNLYVNSRKGAYTSTDGQDWTALTEISQTITSVAYNSSLYVAAGELGIIYSSTDGLSWTKRESHTTTSINSLVYGTTLVAVGNSGYLSTSTDGITWDLGDSGVEYNLSGLGYGNSTYLAASISSFQSYIITASNTYSYNSVTDFQLPTDNDLNITTETVSNFPRKLYIKYQ